MCEYFQGSCYCFFFFVLKFRTQIHRCEATNEMSPTKPEKKKKVIGTKLAIQEESQAKRVIPVEPTALCVFPGTRSSSFLGNLSRRRIHVALKSCETENTGKNNS